MQVIICQSQLYVNTVFISALMFPCHGHTGRLTYRWSWEIQIILFILLHICESFCLYKLVCMPSWWFRLHAICFSFIDVHNISEHWQTCVCLGNSFSSCSRKTTNNLIPSSTGTNCTEQWWEADCISRNNSAHGVSVDTEVWHSQVGDQSQLQVRDC